MRGHQHLVSMRLKGQHPPSVFLLTEPDRLQCWRDWHAIGGAPTVEVEPDDTIARLDLRWAHGMTVILSGSDPERVDAVLQACREFGAKRVFAAVSTEDGLRTTDTETACA